MRVDIKKRSRLPESCEGCKYQKYLYSTHSNVTNVRICNYIVEEGKPRGCSMYACMRYTQADTNIVADKEFVGADTAHA